MKRARLWIGIGISLVCVILALRGIDFEGLAHALVSIRWPYLLPGVAALLLAAWLRAVRWRLLFYPRKDLSTSTLFSIINIGYLFINILPARLGELVRAYLAGELLDIEIPRALSTIVLERVLDVLGIVILLLSLAPLMPLPSWAVNAGLAAGSVSLILVAIMVIIAAKREKGILLGTKLARYVPIRYQNGFSKAWIALVDGLAVLREPKQLALVIALTFGVWAASAGINLAVQAGFALPAPPWASLLVLCTTALGMVIPSSPGYIGVYEYITVMALAIFSIDRELALSYGLLAHGINYVGLSLLGLLGIARESISYSEIRNSVQQMTTKPEGG